MWVILDSHGADVQVALKKLHRRIVNVTHIHWLLVLMAAHVLKETAAKVCADIYNDVHHCNTLYVWCVLK